MAVVLPMVWLRQQDVAIPPDHVGLPYGFVIGNALAGFDVIEDGSHIVCRAGENQRR